MMPVKQSFAIIMEEVKVTIAAQHITPQTAQIMN